MATDNRKELCGTFDTAVSLYEKMRPGYVDELYKAIFDYVSIDENSSVVEVGSGSGQATLPILKAGCGKFCHFMTHLIAFAADRRPYECIHIFQLRPECIPHRIKSHSCHTVHSPLPA